MISRQQIKILIFVVVGALLCLLALSCGGSKAQSNAANANAQVAAPAVVDVSVTPAVSRQLPRFLEATGSRAAD